MARPSRRASVAAASALTVALTLGGFLSMVPMANADGGFSCPEVMPGLGNGPVAGYDNNTNVFVGGNFTVSQAAAEAEGLMVVMGNASFNKEGQTRYNVGVVGVGSQIVPVPGAEMLLVGGDISSNGTTVDVGAGNAAGGDARIRGLNNIPVGKLEMNGGQFTSLDAGAVSGHAQALAGLAAASGEFSGLADTGTVVADKWSVVLQGNGTASPQVFTVDGGTLGSAAANVSLQLKGIPAGARVVVNVTGAPSAGLHFNALLDAAGVPINTNANPPAESAFGAIAANLVWNFETAANVTVGGQAQVPGMILVPTPGGTTDIYAPGTNGRILVAGDLSHRGSGSEMHAYPLLGHEDFGCKVPGGEIEATTPAATTPAATLTPATTPATTPAATLTPATTVATTPATTAVTTPAATLSPATTPATLSPATTPATTPAGTPAPSASSAPDGLASTGLNANSTLLFGGAALMLLALGALAVGPLRRH